MLKHDKAIIWKMLYVKYTVNGELGKTMTLWQATRMAEFTVMIITGLVCTYALILARRKDKPFGDMRPIVPMLHLEEAIGRAVEQGRPVCFTHSSGTLYTVGAPAVAAALSILGKISESCAKYDAPMRVFCKGPLTFQVTQEVVREAFRTAGYPERYKDEYVHFGSFDYFAWYNSVMAYMIKYEPGASFLFGSFAGAGLPMSETGARVAAMQIGGNHVFFALSCDYFTISEELYASGAYCSEDPEMISTIAAEDIVKILCLILMLIGIVAGYSGLAQPIIDALLK